MASDEPCIPRERENLPDARPALLIAGTARPVCVYQRRRTRDWSLAVGNVVECRRGTEPSPESLDSIGAIHSGGISERIVEVLLERSEDAICNAAAVT